MKNLNSFTIIALLVFICYGVFLSIGLQKGFPQKQYNNGFFSYLSERPLTEDGFYSLTVSWNIASGKGVTYNGEIPTTGFQPLSVFIESALAYIIIKFGGDKYLFLRAVVIFSVLLQVLFAFLIYRIACVLTTIENKRILLFVSVLCVLFNFKLFLIFTNGLESGLYLVGLAYLFNFLFSDFYNKQKSPNTFLLGLISGLLLLIRNDFTLILFSILIIMIVKKELSLTKSILVCFYALVINIPWLLYTYSVTGSILSSSVQIQTGLIGSNELGLRIDDFFTSVIHYLTPFLYTGIKIKVVFYIVGAAYIGVLAYLYKSYYKDIFISEKIKRFLWYAIPFGLLLIVYLFYSSAPYFYIRYFSVISVIALPLFVLIISEFIQRLRMKKAITPAIYSFVLIVFFIQATLYFHVGKSSMSYAYRPGFIQRNFKGGIKIAAFQTGTIGYFLPDIYNLDGKVDYNVIKYSRNRELGRYVDSLGIEVLIAWEQYLPNFKEGYLTENWDVYTPDIGDSQSICFIRKNDSGVRKMK